VEDLFRRIGKSEDADERPPTLVPGR